MLYPYRATSAKNQVRFQWGVLMPADVVARDSSERDTHRTERRGRRAAGELTVHGPLPAGAAPDRRAATEAGFADADRLDVGDAAYVPWDEAVERESTITVPLVSTGSTTGDGLDHRGWLDHRLLEVLGGTDGRGARGRSTAARRGPAGAGPGAAAARRRGRPSSARASPYAVGAWWACGSAPSTPATGAARRPTGRPGCVVRSSPPTCCSGSTAGASSRQLDPPEWAQGYAAARTNDGALPGAAARGQDATVMLASPIILYDHAARGARERDRLLRRPRGRRAAQPAHDDPVRGGEARGARHRPPHRGAARRGGRDAGRSCGTGCTARCATSTR